jgi:hypothetical protein
MISPPSLVETAAENSPLSAWNRSKSIGYVLESVISAFCLNAAP